MTDDLVARLRDRLAKATPGEWFSKRVRGFNFSEVWAATKAICPHGFADDDDADLIADLKTYAPALLYEIEALRAENARLREGGWQPIETAPRDRDIWLAAPYHMRIGYWAQGAGHENHGTKGGGWIDFAMAEAGGVRGLRFAPTHWQPLPAPPATEEKG